MKIVDTRRDIKDETDVCLKCTPIFGTDEMATPANRPKTRQFSRGISYAVDIKLRYRETVVPMKITSSAPPWSVEFQARVAFGTGVEFEDPRPTSWTPGRVYQLRKIRDLQRAVPDPRMTISGNVRVQMTMR
jgi:hypothetical protein